MSPSWCTWYSSYIPCYRIHIYPCSPTHGSPTHLDMLQDTVQPFFWRPQPSWQESPWVYFLDHTPLIYPSKASLWKVHYNDHHNTRRFATGTDKSLTLSSYSSVAVSIIALHLTVWLCKQPLCSIGLTNLRIIVSPFWKICTYFCIPIVSLYKH